MPDGNPKIEREKVLLSWKAKSQPFKPGEVQMQPVLVVMVILVAIVLCFAGEWMLLLVMAAGIFYFYANRRTPPMDVEFAVTNKGIRAFGRLYLWWEFKGWWWEEKLATKMMTLSLTTGMVGRIYVPVENIKPAEVEALVNKYLPMTDKPPDTWTDKMAGWVKEKFPLENKS